MESPSQRYLPCPFVIHNPDRGSEECKAYELKLRDAKTLRKHIQDDHCHWVRCMSTGSFCRDAQRTNSSCPQFRQEWIDWMKPKPMDFDQESYLHALHDHALRSPEEDWLNLYIALFRDRESTYLLPTNPGDAIQIVSSLGYQEFFQILRDNGIDVRKLRHSRETFQIASASGYQEIIQKLLVRGVDPNAKSYFHDSPLLVASANEDRKIERALLDHDRDHHMYASSSTPLLAASVKGHLEIVQVLLGNGADPNMSADSYTPLFAASGSGHFEVVQALVENGADPNIGTKWSTPLVEAARRRCLKIIRILLENGADIDGQSWWYPSPLYVSSLLGDLDAVRTLLEEGADVNLIHPDGNALQAASYSGRVEVVQLLLKKGADVNMQHRDGSALQVASRGGHTEVVQMLQRWGATDSADRATSESAHATTSVRIIFESSIVQCIRLISVTLLAYIGLIEPPVEPGCIRVRSKLVSFSSYS